MDPAVNLLSTNNDEQPQSSALFLLLKGFVFTCFSPVYYREVMKRSFGFAVLFLALFALLPAALLIVTISVELRTLASIPVFFENNNLHSVTVADGVATVEGRQPIYRSEEGTFIGIDTTGYITSIDTDRFSQGFLLTKTELHIVNEGDYEVMPLSDIPATAEDPFVIDRAIIRAFWILTSSVMLLVTFVMAYMWHFGFRLGYLAALGFIVWSASTIWVKDSSYEKVLLAGIFASVPALYLTRLVHLAGAVCAAIDISIMLMVWGAALYLALRPQKPELPIPDML